MAWLFKSDWDTNPRNPTWADFVNLAKDQGRAGFGAWGGNVDAGGYDLNNLRSIAGVGGNVGIGVVSPSGTLSIGCPDTSTQPSLSMRYAGAPTYGFDWDSETATVGRLDLYRVNAGVRALALTVLRQSGNVGIGTSAPFHKLSIAGGDYAYNATASGAATFCVSAQTGGQLDENLLMGVSMAGYSWIQAMKPGTAARHLMLNGNGGGIVQALPSISASDAVIPTNCMHVWYDEAGNRLVFRVRSGAGVYKTGYLGVS